MKKNRYTKEFEDFIKQNVSKYKKEDLRLLLEKKYNIKLSRDALRRYINRHNIQKYSDYKKYNVRNVHRCPVGTERITSEGTFVKIAHPDNWRRKTRVVYEKYHNCKLSDDDYIVFLNQNRNDYSKKNLIKITREEMTYLYNGKIYSKNPKLTELGILSAKLRIKAKELKGVKDDN